MGSGAGRGGKLSNDAVGEAVWEIGNNEGVGGGFVLLRGRRGWIVRLQLMGFGAV